MFFRSHAMNNFVAYECGDPESDDDGGWYFEDDEPSFIYTTDGIYDVPKRYIRRDIGKFLLIDPRTWCEVRKEHRALSAATFLKPKKSLSFNDSHLVCVANPDDGSNNVLWFVRLVVDADISFLSDYLGFSFLWQVPHDVSRKIAIVLRQEEQDFNLHGESGHDLLRSLACSYVDFKKDDWPSFSRVDELSCDYEMTYAMACAPCSGIEAELPHKLSLSRPHSMQPSFKSVYFDSSAVPDDAMASIMDAAAYHLVDSPHDSDFQELLKLRIICKAWRDTVDRVATKHYNDVLHLVIHAFESHLVSDIVEARDRLVGSGLSVISMIRDLTGNSHPRPINYINYLRAKSFKHTDSMPHQ